MGDTISAKEWMEMKSMVMDIREMVSVLVNETGKELLTPNEICQLLKIGRSTYQRYVEAGLFEQIHLGNNNSRVYVRRSEIEKLINEGKI